MMVAAIDASETGSSAYTAPVCPRAVPVLYVGRTTLQSETQKVEKELSQDLTRLGVWPLVSLRLVSFEMQEACNVNEPLIL